MPPWQYHQQKSAIPWFITVFLFKSLINFDCISFHSFRLTHFVSKTAFIAYNDYKLILVELAQRSLALFLSVIFKSVNKITFNVTFDVWYYMVRVVSVNIKFWGRVQSFRTLPERMATE